MEGCFLFFAPEVNWRENTFYWQFISFLRYRTCSTKNAIKSGILSTGRNINHRNGFYITKGEALLLIIIECIVKLQRGEIHNLIGRCLNISRLGIVWQKIYGSPINKASSFLFTMGSAT